MKSIQTRLEKRFDFDIDLFLRIHDDPSLLDSITEIEGVNTARAINTLMYYLEDPETQGLKFMLLRTLK